MLLLFGFLRQTCNYMRLFCCYLIIVIVSFACSSRQENEQKETGSQNAEVGGFLDRWHLAAARADSATFFGSMADESIYIGTDATERWTKSEFISFAAPYFRRGKAWDFKPYDRDLHFTADGQHVWFSELLTTWMGICRGSGVAHKTDNGWQIDQYHLSVTVPNDAIRDFIKLVENFEQQQQTKPAE